MQHESQLTFQEICQAVKKYCVNSLKLHFRAYDVVSELDQWDRRVELIRITDAIGSEFVQRIEWTTVANAEEVKMYHDQYVEQGNEGAILRDRYGKYEQGFRSSHLLKVKEFDEEEFEMRDIEKGQRDEDLIAVCYCDAGEFRAKFVGTKEEKVKLLNWWIHTHDGSPVQLSIKFFGWTTDGLPRFPVGKNIRNYE